MSTSSRDDTMYLRVALVSSEHPRKPLAGTVLAFSTGHDIDIPDDAFDTVREQAQDRFDVDSYAEGLRFATLYITEDENNVEGVVWEDSPVPYTHGEFNEAVSELPDGAIPVEPN